jgi:hypothetical protein
LGLWEERRGGGGGGQLTNAEIDGPDLNPYVGVVDELQVLLLPLRWVAVHESFRVELSVQLVARPLLVPTLSCEKEFA